MIRTSWRALAWFNLFCVFGISVYAQYTMNRQTKNALQALELVHQLRQEIRRLEKQCVD